MRKKIRRIELVVHNKGQSLIECLVMTPVLILCLGILGQVFYLGFSYIWIDQSLYQGVICLASNVPANKCQQETYQKLDSLLPYGELKKVQFHFSYTRVQRRVTYHGTIEWGLKSPLALNTQKEFLIKKNLSLRQSQIERASRSFF